MGSVRFTAVPITHAWLATVEAKLIASAVTTIVNVNSTVSELPSVAVYVKVALVNRPVGVPANTRVAAVNVTPSGSVGERL